MDNVKREKLRKYNEARLGKSVDEIAEIDKQDLIDKQIELLAHKLLNEQFAEENDNLIGESNRQRTINPMSDEYSSNVNIRRIKMGYEPLSTSGISVHSKTLDYCYEQARQIIESVDVIHN